MTRSRRSPITLSDVLAFAMVAAAGVIAWYSLGGDSNVPTAADPVTLPGETPAAVMANPGRIAEGHLPTRLVVPTAGIDTTVAEVGVLLEDGEPVWETAWHAAGHHLNSARPGQPGNMVLTGHVSVASAATTPVFATLDRVAAGDVIEVHAGEDTYRYAVRDIQVVEPTATRLLRSDHRATVTLITCTPDLKHRLVVIGELVPA